MTSKRVLLGLSVASAIAQILSTSAYAAQPSTGELEEVVVTAERREANLQSVPVAVSAFTAEAIENRQITEARDLERVVPSLKMLNNITSPTNLSPSLRGSTVQDASMIVTESPFGIYVDDVYVGRLNGNNVTLADIERVEVLRGPQGTLYGRNTLAGAIKFVSRTPGREPWFNVTAGGGNWNQYLGSISLGAPITDSLAGSFSAQINNKDGQFRNVTTNQKVGLERNWAMRGKLHWNGEKTDVVFSISHADGVNDSLQLPGGFTPGVPANRQFTSDDIVLAAGCFYCVKTPWGPKGPQPLEAVPRAFTKQTITSLNVGYDLGDATVRSITGYVQLHDFFNTDFSGGNLVGILPGQPVIMAAIDTNHGQFTQELQVQGKAMDGRLNYIGGAFYLHEAGTQKYGWYFFAPVSNGVLRSSTTSYSVFGQADYKLNDDLKLTFGGRWTKDKKDFDTRFNGLPLSAAILGFPLPARTDRVIKDAEYSAFTPKLGLDWSLPSGGAIDSMLLYGSVARGFKSGGFNGITIFGLDDARNDYGPEKNWTYEAGLKTDLFGNKLRVNAVYFLTKVSDLQLNATLNGGTSFPVQNAGDSKLQGVELETTYVPTQGLTLFFNAALMDGKYTSLSPGASPAQAPVAFGVAKPIPPQIPDYTFSLGFDWGIPVGPGTFKFGADYYRTDDYVVAAANDFVVKGYGRVGAFVGYEVGKVTFRVNAKNVTDEENIVSGSRALGGFIVLPRREVLATVNWKM
jgi:iron complex outermembrane receptor protein